MITGFNTDIEHDGVVYHVQTEDKGLDSPIILSLVYTGGTILASKRSPYHDLIAEGFSDEVLAERLKRQHRLICAAIHSGRINDLKKMSGRPKQAVAEEQIVEPVPVEVELPIELPIELPVELEATPELETSMPPAEEPFEIEYWPMSQEWTPPPPAPLPEEVAPAEEVQPEREFELVEEPVRSPESYAAEESQPEELTDEAPIEDGLVISLLDDDEFYSGESYTLRVLIGDRKGGEEKPLANVAVSVKILGTTFRPLIYTLKTESDGVASLSTEIPQFTSGRAAVLVRAVAKDQAAELRRIIHPAQ